MDFSYRQYKWLNLIGFALLYNTAYIGRFNLDNALPQLCVELEFTTYQQSLLGLVVYLTYAVGSFVNGRIADKTEPKKIVALGVIVSIVANCLVIFAESWLGIFILWAINGYFQSMIWIGGMCLIVRWWKSNERGCACGIVNFASGISHVTAYVLPIFIGASFPYFTWRGLFVVPMGVIGIFLVVFWLFATDSPSEVGKEPYVENNKLVEEREAYLKEEVSEKHGNPWRYFFTRPKFLWWCTIALLSSLCRYGLLKWIPIYYATSTQGKYILDPTFLKLILPIGMAFGTLIITWVTVKGFIYNKGLMVICSCALCGSLMLIFPIMSSTVGILMGIFCTGFFLYGINGVLWIYALDRGGRVYPGTTVGILNCCAYLGASLEAFVFPLVLRITGDMIFIFIVMEIICIAMVVCGMVVSERDTSFEVDDTIK